MNILAKKSKAKGSTLLKSFKGLGGNAANPKKGSKMAMKIFVTLPGLSLYVFPQRLSTCKITRRYWNLQIPYATNMSFEANMITNKPRQS